ncbi:hypothetical protein GOV10_00655 [Candidatus Woesearchaeota archaeon]|nr:hypothetical protein [Candidatus Woesearchaeota archaeon]
MAKKKSVSKTPKKVAKKAPAKKVKKTPAKTVKKAPAKKMSRGPKKVALLSTQKENESSFWPIVLVIIGVAIIATVVWVMFSPGPDVEVDVVSETEIAASVNGVDILTVKLNQQYNMLPEQYKAVYTLELVLEQLISEELLIQHGEERGIEVSDEDVQIEVQGILAGDMTLEELEGNLAQFDMTFEDFEELIARKLMIERSMADLMSNAESVSDEAVRAYYDEHITDYEVSEQATVRHILIASQRDNAATFSKDLMDQIKDGADFCQLVVEETDDKGSAEKCGEYTFPRGMMVPEFETASFDMNPGDLTLVQTNFGYHIIEKLADVPASQQSFEDVEEFLRASLNQEASTAYYATWVDDQRLTGDVEIFI